MLLSTITEIQSDVELEEKTYRLTTPFKSDIEQRRCIQVDNYF